MLGGTKGTPGSERTASSPRPTAVVASGMAVRGFSDPYCSCVDGMATAAAPEGGGATRADGRASRSAARRASTSSWRRCEKKSDGRKHKGFENGGRRLRRESQNAA